MMRRPAVWSLNLVGLLYGGVLYTDPSLFPGLLQARLSTGYGLGKSVTMSGLIVLPMSVAVFVAGFSVSRAWRRAGIGLCSSAMGALIVDAVPPDQTGVASGMNANIRTMGGAPGRKALPLLSASNPCCVLNRRPVGEPGVVAGDAAVGRPESRRNLARSL